MQKYQGISRLLEKSSMPRPEERALLEEGRKGGHNRKGGEEGHQDLKPTDDVGPPTDVVGPPHASKSKWLFLRTSRVREHGVFTHRVGTKERMCRLR